jgi:lactoylglutathione lyase
MLTHIKTVALYVENQEKALAFYTEKLGFEVRKKEQMGPQVFWIELAPPGAQTCLVIYPKVFMQDWQHRKPSIMFACENVEATYEELLKRGVTFIDTPQKMSIGIFAKFADPDGNEILIISPLS